MVDLITKVVLFLMLQILVCSREARMSSHYSARHSLAVDQHVDSLCSAAWCAKMAHVCCDASLQYSNGHNSRNTRAIVPKFSQVIANTSM